MSEANTVSSMKGLYKEVYAKEPVKFFRLKKLMKKDKNAK